MKYVGNAKFFKAICLLLCDLFAYRVDLTSEQFFAKGYSERKILLCLNVYEILKKVRKQLKVNEKLGA